MRPDSGYSVPIIFSDIKSKDSKMKDQTPFTMDNNLFVSKYQLELPKKEEIRKFIEEQMREVRG
jgi:hypothetical protein